MLVGVAVGVGVLAGIGVAVAVLVGIGVAVLVGVAIAVNVGVGVLVGVGVGVLVSVGVGVAALVGVEVGVLVGVGSGSPSQADSTVDAMHNSPSSATPRQVELRPFTMRSTEDVSQPTCGSRSNVPWTT